MDEDSCVFLGLSIPGGGGCKMMSLEVIGAITSFCAVSSISGLECMGLRLLRGAGLC